MRKLLPAILAALLLGGAEPPDPFLPDYESIDLLISNGRVIDGLGGAPVEADVVVVGDEIVHIGDTRFSQWDLRRRVHRHIDAGGRVVTPGFIDLHSHGDPLETPAFENFLAMGVTTITLGQDGSSAATADLPAWLDAVAHRGTGPNLATLVGHGTLRRHSGIGRTGEPGGAALEEMLELLRGALDHAFGLSTGLEYNPGLNAGTEELQALAEVVGSRQRIIMSHMRSEDDDALEASIGELLRQARHAPVHISHLKSVYGKGAGRAEEILALLARARADGFRITADVYPYTASYTGIGILFPVWAKTPEQFDLAVSERRAELERYLVRRVRSRNGPGATLLGTAPHTGKTLAELADELDMPFEQVLIDEIGPGGASAAYFVMDEALQSRLLIDPHVGIGSDGSPGMHHPRGYGSFARVIEHHVQKEGLLTLREAIRKMTSLPAEILGIDDRGILAPGKKADLVIFHPDTVEAVASYTDPKQLARGFDWVIVNGKIARRQGQLAKELSGRVLRPRG